MNIKSQWLKITLFFIALCMIAGCNSHQCQRQTDRTLVIAHRGFSAEYPENTIAAFKAAVAAKADYIEIDVHLSKDGKIVVMHDDTIDRTTNGTGFVNDYTLIELREFDAGAWFNDKFAGERIPTLLEEIEIVENTQTRLCVEIKEKQKQHYPGLEKRLVEIVQQNDLIGQLVVTSFNKDVVTNLKNIEPRIAIAYDPSNEEYEAFKKQASQCAVTVLGTGANMACFNHKHLSKEIIAECLLNGVPLWVWTVNDENTMEKLVGFGIEAIMTDKPDILRNVINRN